mmetsp:Transcript_64433/g.207542  ORF Transcript_64433/g.207542 Transcript_64433/m.207542 type:complete len:218 (+) Transcript_64433:196-849(+)
MASTAGASSAVPSTSAPSGSSVTVRSPSAAGTSPSAISAGVAALSAVVPTASALSAPAFVTPEATCAAAAVASAAAAMASSPTSAKLFRLCLGGVSAKTPSQATPTMPSPTTNSKSLAGTKVHVASAPTGASAENSPKQRCMSLCAAHSATSRQSAAANCRTSGSAGGAAPSMALGRTPRRASRQALAHLEVWGSSFFLMTTGVLPFIRASEAFCRS